MATFRVGVGSFNIQDGAVGFGTDTDGLGNLKVKGVTKTTDIKVSGASTLTRYSGFAADNTNIDDNTTFDCNETVTYTVTVQNVGGVNIYLLDGVNNPTLTMKRGSTYIFDQSDNTNTNHPLRFKDINGTSYYDGVFVAGIPGSSGAFTRLKVDLNAPDSLRYYCTVHGNAMGNAISVIDPAHINVGNIGDIIVNVGSALTVATASTIIIGTVDSVSIGTHFSPPTGGIEERGDNFVEGMMRFNTDLNTMEFYNGNEWRQFTYVSDIQNSPSGAGRAVLFRGATDKFMEFFNIMTLGNTENFGTMIEERNIAAGSGSKTRGIIGGGYDGPASGYSQSSIEYITLASQGDGISFGELSASHFRNSGGCSSSTRGLFFGGGHPSYQNTIEYVEIDTLGNALDFGDQVDSVAWRRCFSSPTRGFSKGGFPFASSIGINVVTIASKGNAVEFGKLNQNMHAGDGCANSVRGIYAGGYAPGFRNNIQDIQYITMASDGDAINFGDLITGSDSPSAVANQVRAVISGGYVSPAKIKRMEFITIASTGNAQSFGDLSIIDSRACGTTDAHGGLGGF